MPDLHKALSAALLVGGLMTVSSVAQATTGSELLRQCETLERGAVVRGDRVRLPEHRDAAQCWFYMAAVQDFAATVEEEGGPSLLGSCPASDSTRLDFVRAFNSYARAHRSELGLRASALVIRALTERYPCKAR